MEGVKCGKYMYLVHLAYRGGIVTKYSHGSSFIRWLSTWQSRLWNGLEMGNGGVERVVEECSNRLSGRKAPKPKGVP